MRSQLDSTVTPRSGAPSLRDVQRAVARSLLDREAAAADCFIVADGLAPARRLSVYRNTFEASCANALRLAFPAVHRLVGADFFAVAASVFVHAEPPRNAWLDTYGASFPAFLAKFPPAASLAYLPDVARLEWAVNRALHAADVAALDVSRLARLSRVEHPRVRFVAHPSVSLVDSACPIDAIWRAVLARDDAALAAIDPAAGCVWLLVGRSVAGVDVVRMEPRAWRFTAALLSAEPIGAALATVGAIGVPTLLAGLLAGGRFVDFDLIDAGARPLDRDRR